MIAFLFLSYSEFSIPSKQKNKHALGFTLSFTFAVILTLLSFIYSPQCQNYSEFSIQIFITNKNYQTLLLSLSLPVPCKNTKMQSAREQQLPSETISLPPTEFVSGELKKKRKKELSQGNSSRLLLARRWQQRLPRWAGRGGGCRSAGRTFDNELHFPQRWL